MCCFSTRLAAIVRASFSSNTASSSPADGTSFKPRTSTGTDGPAFLTFSPRSLIIARTLPKQVPATMESPMWRVPFCTRTVATEPRPLSSFASMMIPRASHLALAFSSCISATKRIISSRPLILICFLAETSTIMVSPPYSSATRPCSISSFLTRVGSAPGLSILLIATIIGTSADFAW